VDFLQFNFLSFLQSRLSRSSGGRALSSMSVATMGEQTLVVKISMLRNVKQGL
jgi:hypothetical protein